MMKGKSRSGETHGKGGVGAACSRNPNSHPELNDTPDGPGAHFLGYTGDAGYAGDESVDHRGASFHFK